MRLVTLTGEPLIGSAVEGAPGLGGPQIDSGHCRQREGTMSRTPPAKAYERAAGTGPAQTAGASTAGRLSRGILRSLVAVVMALGLAVAGAAAAGASTASAAATAYCTRTVTGMHHGALVAG